MLHETVFRPSLLLVIAIFALMACLCDQVQTQASQTGAPGPGFFVEIEGSKLYYEECGSAPQTVVLVHDGVVNSAVWDDVWPEFCKHFRVIRYDRRGYGRSPAPTTWYSETDDLLSLLHHLKVSRVALVGSSHGGELSIDFTLAHPEIVQQLVLVGAVVSGMPYSQHFLDRGKHAFELLGKGDVKGAISEWSKDKYLIAPGNDAARKRLFDLLSANPQDMQHPDYPLRNKPSLPRLHEIHVPTLILTGDADVPDVHAHAGAIEAGIPNSRRVVVAGTGHIMYLEKPAEFSRLVINFIEQNTN
ncbi:MAG: alpha/beta hydrolase [Verrucomicrobia bacterium]|nr:MAG: alpha/beta hydrolase [Verrucomicrobiota bacterium]PYK32866.1 MAG: alpha/beta hydrolase [Verrucomicrobiota bacterium]PYL80450.1 MAG: alpha/beta hydrolase [Verrucomicrobiota bacterium]